ncbi:MAG TPA: hypothetical protein VGE02_16475 [Gemmatimonadales bacterium]
MTETTVSAPALVTELDEERRRYETWLEQLEARRGDTPEHVYLRVRDDYRQRLQGVVDRLGEHAESLRAAVAELEQRSGELRAEEQRVRDDRAEAELRAMVGEYDAEHWQDLQSRADQALADLGARRGEAEEELDRLGQLLALATGGSAIPASAGAEPEMMELDDRVEPGRRSGDVPLVTAPGEVEVPIVPASAPGGLGNALDGWSRELDEEVAPLPEPRRQEHVSPESASTAIKTLRCQECGTMNYPTEWYCERCGGELATL